MIEVGASAWQPVPRGLEHRLVAQDVDVIRSARAPSQAQLRWVVNVLPQSNNRPTGIQSASASPPLGTHITQAHQRHRTIYPPKIQSKCN